MISQLILQRDRFKRLEKYYRRLAIDKPQFSGRFLYLADDYRQQKETIEAVLHNLRVTI